MASFEDGNINQDESIDEILLICTNNLTSINDKLINWLYIYYFNIAENQDNDK